jgi:hypothetical protein
MTLGQYPRLKTSGRATAHQAFHSGKPVVFPSQSEMTPRSLSGLSLLAFCAVDDRLWPKLRVN